MELKSYFYGTDRTIWFDTRPSPKCCEKVFPIASLEGVYELDFTHAVKKFSVHSLFDLKVLLSDGAPYLPRDIKMVNAINNIQHVIAYTENSNETNKIASALSNTDIKGVAVYLPFDLFRKLI
jgi:hypothetical protein